MSDAGYVVIDTETNDLPDYKRPADADGQPRLAALAMILVTSTLELEQSADLAYIKPDGLSMQPGATAVNGLTDEFLHANGVPVIGVLEAYSRVIRAGRPVIAFNSRFDCKIMRGELRLAGMDDLFEQTPNWCTMRASAKTVNARNVKGGFKWPSLKEACAHFHIEVEGPAHRADLDAMRCLRLAQELRATGIAPRPEIHYAKNPLKDD